MLVPEAAADTEGASLAHLPLPHCCVARVLASHRLVPVHSPGVGDPALNDRNAEQGEGCAAEVDERGLRVCAHGSHTGRRTLRAGRSPWAGLTSEKTEGLRQQRQSHCLKLSQEGQVTVRAEATGKSC